MSKKRVVIAGMGFAGLRAAKSLAGSELEIIMIDRNNYHLFQPLLYQVATAGLEQEAIAYPLRGLTRQWDSSTFMLAEITSVNLENSYLDTDAGRVSYDYLVIAAGSRTNFFGMDSVAAHAFDLKRLDQAEDLRNHILLMFENASIETDPEKRSALLTFVIVGGGPTGVEFAGALRELIVYVLSRDYPSIKTSETRILLLEAADSLLTAMPVPLREYAFNRLSEMGVEVMLECKVIGATEKTVELYGDRTINSCTLFWSAGVAAAELAGQLINVERGAGGRVVVQPDMTLKEYGNVFVVGDMACCLSGKVPLPMMAPVASQQGDYVGRAIIAKESGRTMPPFKYVDKGSMATIGRNSAVAFTAGMSFRGYLAWLAWLLLHLYYLIGFRNRMVVMMDWTYSYLFYERQVRLITAKKRRAAL